MKFRSSFAGMILLVMAFLLTACGQSAFAQNFGTEEFIEALQAEGVEAQKGDVVEQPFFSVTGSFIEFDGGSVQVFEYDSPETMESDAKLVAPEGGSIGTSMIHWIETPHFYKKGRVLVIYLGDDAKTLELLERVLGEQFAGG